jgi:hypothetical protein
MAVKPLSRREYLPMLRGMFVSPEPVKRMKNRHSHVNDYFAFEEGLILTAKEGMYLGE